MIPVILLLIMRLTQSLSLFAVRRIHGYQEYHDHDKAGLGEPIDKSESIARMMSLFLGLTLLLRLVTDVLSDPYLKNSVFENADPRSDFYKETASRWSEALIILSVVRKVSECVNPSVLIALNIG